MAGNRCGIIKIKLNKLGYNVDFESIIRPIKSAGRPYIENALIKQDVLRNWMIFLIKGCDLINLLTLKRSGIVY